MSIKNQIVDGTGNGHLAKVTKYNQLVTGPVQYSTFYNATVDLINTGYNLVVPKDAKRFVITDVILYANKNVGVGDATVVLYEAEAVDTTTVSKTIINQELPQKTSLILSGLNIIVTKGRWVNIKTDDDDIFANIAGYYVNERESITEVI